MKRRLKQLANASVLTLTAGCAHLPQMVGSNVVPTGHQKISFTTNSGTALAFDISRDGRTIVFDLLGQLWMLPANGGAAQAITDAVRDTAEDLDPVLSPDGRQIAFQGDRGGVKGLWLINRDGSGLRRLTDSTSSDASFPAWAPDGLSLAFSLRDSIRIMDVRTGVIRTLRVEGAPSPVARTPAWSPDGTRIAFGHSAGRIWEVSSNGGMAHALTPADLVARVPAYSPDGSRIAFFARDSAGVMHVWTHTRNGGAPVRLTSHRDVTPLRMRWSPAGEALLYAADGQLWRRANGERAPRIIPFSARISLNRSQSALRPVQFPKPSGQLPARGHMGMSISPDGEHIAVIALGKLWVIPIDGPPRGVVTVPPTAAGLAWSPDGKQLVWSAGKGGSEDLFITQVETGSTRQFSALPGREDRASWSPDGKWIAFLHWPKPSCNTPPSQVDDECGRFRLRVVSAMKAALDSSSAGRVLDAGLDFSWIFAFFGKGQETPQWSPTSEGLFIASGASASFVPLDGKRRTLGAFPGGATFVSLRADSSLVYVLDNQLWRSALPSLSGPLRPERLYAEAALYPTVARNGTILFLAEDGLRLLRPDGGVKRIGWPLSFEVTAPPEPVLIRGGLVIDGTGAPPSARDIMLSAGRIARVAPPGTIPVPQGTRIVDARGRTIIPGLIDLHAHLWDDAVLPAALSNGVTTIREMGGSAARVSGFRDAGAAGVFPAPRVILGGFQFYPGGNGSSGVVIQSPSSAEGAARGIALLRALGGEYVKMRAPDNQKSGVWMIREAHKAGLRVSGHCAHTFPLVAAGIDGKEHLGLACANRSDGIWYDDMIQLFRAAWIFIVPTSGAFASVPRLLGDTTLLSATGTAPFVTPFLRWWGLRLSPASGLAYTRFANTSRAAVSSVHRQGIVVAPGSDDAVFPNALHAELEQLVASGFSPLEAITAATGTAARVLGAEAEIGTIVEGKLADLVILDADPLADIRNTQRISQIILGGRTVDRDALLRWDKVEGRR